MDLTNNIPKVNKPLDKVIPDSILRTATHLRHPVKSLHHMEDNRIIDNVEPTGEAQFSTTVPRQARETIQRKEKPSTTNDSRYEGEEVHKSKGTSIFTKIKRLGCSILLFIVFAILALLGTIIFRPPLTWNPLKNFLNADFKPGAVEDYTYNQTIDVINSSITNSEKTTFTLTESQVSALFKNNISGHGPIVEFEDNIMNIVLDLDDTTPTPLWGIIQFKETQNNELKINKIGFGKFGLPRKVNTFLSSFILNAINLTQGNLSGDKSSESIISALITKTIKDKIKILNVTFKQDKLQVRYGVR